MKTKIRKIGSASNVKDRVQGIGDFQCTGPCPECGTRVTKIYSNCLRTQAERKFSDPLERVRLCIYQD